MKQWFYILASPMSIKREEIIRAERHDCLAEAVKWMGRGIVINEDQEIVAFHESQLGFVEHAESAWIMEDVRGGWTV